MMEADIQQLELAIRQQRVITRLRLALEQVPNDPHHDDRKRLLLMLITAIDDQPNYHNHDVEVKQLETLVDDPEPAQVDEAQPAQVDEAQPAQEAQPAAETQPAQDLRDIMKGNHDPVA